VIGKEQAMRTNSKKAITKPRSESEKGKRTLRKEMLKEKREEIGKDRQDR